MRDLTFIVLSDVRKRISLALIHHPHILFLPSRRLDSNVN